MRFLRRLDRLGYAHFRRWKLYGEEALARHPAVIIMLHASDEKRQRFFNYQLLEEPPASHTNLRSEWYNKGNDEGREEDLFWERESHEPLLIFQWKKSNVA